MNLTSAGECRASKSTAAQRWADVVERIRQGDPTGMEDLYQVFFKGVRFFLYRATGTSRPRRQGHDVFVIVAQAIRRGDLRDPERLVGYVRTVVRRQVAGHIEEAVQERRYHADLEGTRLLADHHPDPERDAIENQNEEVARRVLNSIGKTRPRSLDPLLPQ